MRESFLVPFSLDSSLEVKISGCKLSSWLGELRQWRSVISVLFLLVLKYVPWFLLTQRICSTTYTKYWRKIKVTQDMHLYHWKHSIMSTHNKCTFLTHWTKQVRGHLWLKLTSRIVCNLKDLAGGKSFVVVRSESSPSRTENVSVCFYSNYYLKSFASCSRGSVL